MSLDLNTVNNRDTRCDWWCEVSDRETKTNFEAFRLTWLLPPEPIRRNSDILLIPSHCAVIYNVDRNVEIRWEPTIVIPASKQLGIPKARLVECVSYDDSGERIRATHCYLVPRPKADDAFLIETAVRCEFEYAAHLQARRKRNEAHRSEKRIQNTPLAIESRIVNHAENQRRVATEVCSRAYPKLWHLFTSNRAQQVTPNETLAQQAFKALILDLATLHGRSPNFEGQENLLHDVEFMDQLVQALRAHDNGVLLQRLLTQGWIDRRYFEMSERDLAEEIAVRTGRNKKAGSLTKLISRLGLERKTETGRPPTR